MHFTWDIYYYSYSLLMSCLHLVSYKLPASYPVAVKLRFRIHSREQDQLNSIVIQLQENMERVVD